MYEEELPAETGCASAVLSGVPDSLGGVVSITGAAGSITFRSCVTTTGTAGSGTRFVLEMVGEIVGEIVGETVVEIVGETVMGPTVALLESESRARSQKLSRFLSHGRSL